MNPNLLLPAVLRDWRAWTSHRNTRPLAAIDGRGEMEAVDAGRAPYRSISARPVSTES